MKNRRKFIIFYIVILAILMIFLNTNIIYAEGNGIFDQGKDWLETGENNIPQQKASGGYMLDLIFGTADNNNSQGFQQLAGILMGVGFFVVAIVGVWLGIRLMFASAENKAKSKEALIVYLIGTVIIFGALGIWRLLITLLDGSYLYK